ncbi:uncharacterized protein PFL1_01733 [Pseudozyma flocculosa PF-1]|uniref:COX assembly mitochondrial protein n=1 Tax=Pseudozyma flocculosa TaxID=84751 RepID=A0A5C3EWY8_9BASI|nr:uncharacterized protein PFL1_01733 [Pseudozyma flocculosa PF-1]EPQ30835.1 hypothetical protein PFL1_01733 [Pseudozyma flocculosa PF-1]SPO36793.1 related to CMC1 - mitochondrial intermembrane space copper-binding protein [Pseudozyma flocculosa]
MARAISNRESDELMKKTKADALKKCGDVVKAFADCSSGRTVSVAWACRGEHKALQDCLKQYTSPEAFEKVKADYLASNRS